MAKLCLGIATSHIAMLVRTPEFGDPAQVARFRDGYGRLADALHAASPDAVLMVSSDHVNKFFLDNMPAFCIGALDALTGPAEGDLGFGRRSVPSDPELAAHLLRLGLDEGVDWASAGEWEVDHGFMVPLYLLDPDARIPVVPIHVNCAAPPYPSLRRCFEVGRWLATAIERWDADKRVAVVAGGGLSHSPGDARMGYIDSDFDRRFLDALTAGRNDDILALTDAEIDAAGSSTCEIRIWVLLAGAFAGRPFEEIMYEPIAGFGTGCAQCLVTPD